MQRQETTEARRARAALLLVAVLAIGAASVWPAAGVAAANDGRLRLATGPRKGVYYAFGKELETLTADRGPSGLTIQAMETNGSVSNIHLLVQGSCDVAMVQADVLHAAVTGKAPFPEPLPSLRALATLYGEFVHVVARGGAGIATMSDLSGKRIALGAEGSGSVGVALELLEAHGVSRQKIDAQYASLDESLSRFRAGAVDAVVVVMAAPSSVVGEALAAGGVLLPVDKLRAASLSNRAPYFRLDAIAAGTYPGQEQPLEAIRLDAMLCVREDMRSEVAYEVLKTIFDEEAGRGRAASRFKALRRVVPQLRKPDDLQHGDLHAVPLHKGAMAYYDQKKLFARPVEVHTGVFVNDIFHLDIASGTFDVDFYLWFRYTGRIDADPRDFQVEFMNGEIRHKDPPVLERFGEYTYLSYKVVGRFRTSFPLHNYPFDAQVLPIVIEHAHLETDALRFVPDAGIDGRERDTMKTMLEPGIQVGDWHVSAVRQRVQEHVYATDMGSPLVEPGEEQTYSQYRLEVEIRRHLTPYLVKFCVPLMIIVIMSFMVFWIPPEEFQVQVIVAIAALIACVAFHTTQTDNLPRVGYMVTADLFFVVSYAVIFLVLLQVIVEFVVAHRGRKVLARRLDRLARYIFPSAYFGSLGLIIWQSLPV